MNPKISYTYTNQTALLAFIIAQIKAIKEQGDGAYITRISIEKPGIEIVQVMVTNNFDAIIFNVSAVGLELHTDSEAIFRIALQTYMDSLS